jgi:hypothetical protein
VQSDEQRDNIVIVIGGSSSSSIRAREIRAQRRYERPQSAGESGGAVFRREADDHIGDLLRERECEPPSEHERAEERLSQVLRYGGCQVVNGRQVGRQDRVAFREPLEDMRAVGGVGKQRERHEGVTSGNRPDGDAEDGDCAGVVV